MAKQTPTDPIAEVIKTIGTGIKGICENQKALSADQKVISADQKAISDNQKFLLEKFSSETDPLYDQIIQITERLDQIERTIYDDAWAHRSRGANDG